MQSPRTALARFMKSLMVHYIRSLKLHDENKDPQEEGPTRMPTSRAQQQTLTRTRPKKADHQRTRATSLETATDFRAPAPVEARSTKQSCFVCFARSEITKQRSFTDAGPSDVGVPHARRLDAWHACGTLEYASIRWRYLNKTQKSSQGTLSWPRRNSR